MCRECLERTAQSFHQQPANHNLLDTITDSGNWHYFALSLTSQPLINHKSLSTGSKIPANLAQTIEYITTSYREGEDLYTLPATLRPGQVISTKL